MNKLFVPKHLALILKEKGYNEPCFARYNTKSIEPDLSFCEKDYNKPISNEYTTWMQAPLYQQAIDWLRENHSISLTVKHYASGTFSFEIQKHNGDATGWTKQTAFMSKTSFDYYESLKEGIQEALKLI
jgi:hypothetical protein